MKKLTQFILILSLTFIFIGTCFAEFQPDPNRWVWIASDDVAGFWFDKATVKYYGSGNGMSAYAWFLIYRNSPTEGFAEQYYYIFPGRQKIEILEHASFDMNYNMLHHTRLRKVETIVPGTFLDKMTKAVFDYRYH